MTDTLISDRLDENTRRSPSAHLPKWQPGQTGNPGGRPKGVAAYVRTLTLDGTALIDKLWEILQNPTGKPYQRQKTQLECIQLLLDRGFGKAVAVVEHGGEIKHTWDMLAGLDLEDIKALALAYRALQEQKAQAIDGESRVLETSQGVSSSQ